MEKGGFGQGYFTIPSYREIPRPCLAPSRARPGPAPAFESLSQQYLILLPLSAVCSLRSNLRRGRDSNPRFSFPNAAFRVRCLRPLSHLSVVTNAETIPQIHLMGFIGKHCKVLTRQDSAAADANSKKTAWCFSRISLGTPSQYSRKACFIFSTKMLHSPCSHGPIV